MNAIDKLRDISSRLQDLHVDFYAAHATEVRDQLAKLHSELFECVRKMDAETKQDRNNERIYGRCNHVAAVAHERAMRYVNGDEIDVDMAQHIACELRVIGYRDCASAIEKEIESRIEFENPDDYR